MVRGAVTASATELSDHFEFIVVIVVERLLKSYPIIRDEHD